MKNDILKISGVNFSTCLYFWLSCRGFGGFRGYFEHFNEHMQKESPRRCGKDNFGLTPKPNLENTKSDENDDFSDFNFEPRFEAGEPQGSPKGIPSIKK